MKIYISADIEGVTGIAHWDETEKSKGDYSYFAAQMTREVKSACEGANATGVKEIWINDAHDYARNINPLELPQNIMLIREWSGHPFSMMQEIDNSFDGVIMIGYHSPGGSNGNPLAHTLTTGFNYIKINDEIASEFLINAYTAAYVGVPILFVSGDKYLCGEVKKLNNNIKTLAVNIGVGNSSISMHPDLSVKKIKDEIEEILKNDLDKYKIKLPDKFKVEIGYMRHHSAYKASFYPGMKQISPKAVIFETDNYFDVLRMLAFVQ